MYNINIMLLVCGCSRHDALSTISKTAMECNVTTDNRILWNWMSTLHRKVVITELSVYSRSNLMYNLPNVLKYPVVYLFVGHLKELQWRLLQLCCCYPNRLGCLVVTVAQCCTDFCNVLFQLRNLQDTTTRLLNITCGQVQQATYRYNNWNNL